MIINDDSVQSREKFSKTLIDIDVFLSIRNIRHKSLDNRDKDLEYKSWVTIPVFIANNKKNKASVK